MADKRNVLIIGGGSIGARHLNCFQQTGRVDAWLCDINPELCQKIASEYNVERTFTDLDEAIAAGPDAAVICTPAPLHIPFAIKLGQAGIDLLIEKPLSVSLDGIDDLQTLIAEKGLKVSIAYVMRANPIVAGLREAVLSGRFGKPVQLIYTGGQHFPFYRPAYRDIYYTKRSTGGGAIQDALTHVLNASEWILGPMTQVAADAEHKLLEGVDVEDTVHVMARHGDVMASYSMNQHQAPNETSLTVVCERGTVRMESHRSRWGWSAEPEQPWQYEEFPPIERNANFIEQANVFLDYLDGKCPPACTLDEGIQTLRVNLATLKAADTKTWQTISGS